MLKEEREQAVKALKRQKIASIQSLLAAQDQETIQCLAGLKPAEKLSMQQHKQDARQKWMQLMEQKDAGGVGKMFKKQKYDEYVAQV